MKKLPICIFIISLFFGGIFMASAQEEQETDSIVHKERYGLRLGVDLSKPIRSLTDRRYDGYSILGDFRFSKRFYFAGELGYEGLDFSENYMDANSKGSYIKVGVNYNAYSNWAGMENEIYAGMRYGVATFSETLYRYTIYETDHYFPSYTQEVDRKYKGLHAHWIEFQLGIKAEILHNLYLGVHAEVKRMITQKEPSNFENLWIPGYNRQYDNSAFGIGWGYSVSYLIPFAKKEVKE